MACEMPPIVYALQACYFIRSSISDHSEVLFCHLRPLSANEKGVRKTTVVIACVYQLPSVWRLNVMGQLVKLDLVCNVFGNIPCLCESKFGHSFLSLTSKYNISLVTH